MALLHGKHILLIDDHEVFRRGLRTLIAESCGNCRVSDAASIEQAVGDTLDAPDVVLLDIRLPGVSGLDGIGPLKAQWPSAAIAVLSSLDGPEAQAEALARGAAACLSKGESSDAILRQIEVLLDVRPAAAAEAPREPLTPRQREVIVLLGRGLSNKLIARELALSENTVRRHVQDILEHFGVSSRAEAVFAARRRGLAE